MSSGNTFALPALATTPMACASTPLISDIRTFEIGSDETQAPSVHAGPPSPPFIDISFANKENIPPCRCPAHPNPGATTKKLKKTLAVYQGGISKTRTPLALKVVKKGKLAKDPAFEMVKEIAEIKRRLEEAREREILNHRAKELTQLPLGDLSAAYAVSDFHVDETYSLHAPSEAHHHD